MKRDEVARMLKPRDMLNDKELTLFQRFGEACRDPRATILAVNDFSSFERALNTERRKTRKDRLQRLYELYLSISKTQLPLTIEDLTKFKTTLPGYQHASMFYFLQDVCQLHSAGIIIVRTPIINALKFTDEFKRQHMALLKAARRPESEDSNFDELLERILDSKIQRTPPSSSAKKRGKRK